MGMADGKNIMASEVKTDKRIRKMKMITIITPPNE